MLRCIALPSALESGFAPGLGGTKTLPSPLQPPEKPTKPERIALAGGGGGISRVYGLQVHLVEAVENVRVAQNLGREYIYIYRPCVYIYICVYDHVCIYIYN